MSELKIGSNFEGLVRSTDRSTSHEVHADRWENVKKLLDRADKKSEPSGIEAYLIRGNYGFPERCNHNAALMSCSSILFHEIKDAKEFYSKLNAVIRNSFDSIFEKLGR